jgi:hypothetical protein
MKRYNPAADAYERALYLFPELGTVGFGQFDYLVQALKLDSRPCEAIAPLQLYVRV